MIEICTYKELAEGHVSGQVPYRILQEITYVLLGLSNYNGKDIAEPLEVTQKEINWLLALPEDINFMTYLGGNVFLVRAECDLLSVIGIDYEFAKMHGRWPNITEAVLAWDSAYFLINADGTADYALLFAATNNAGGHSWFIPNSLWQAANIDQQISANKQL